MSVGGKQVFDKFAQVHNHEILQALRNILLKNIISKRKLKPWKSNFHREMISEISFRSDEGGKTS